MIVWKVQRPDGITILGLGLEAGNIEKLKRGQPIFRMLGPLGIGNIAVAVHYGETKEAMMKDMEKEGISVIEKIMPEFGPTGAYPRGKLAPGDEGEIRAALSREGDTVRIDFGKDLSWLAMSRNEAKVFAAQLMEMAEGAKEN
jgi:hypothetical protein